jgi:hypothetical protein
LGFAALQQSGVLPLGGALLGERVTGFGRWPNGEVVPARESAGAWTRSSARTSGASRTSPMDKNR